MLQRDHRKRGQEKGCGFACFSRLENVWVKKREKEKDVPGSLRGVKIGLKKGGGHPLAHYFFVWAETRLKSKKKGGKDVAASVSITAQLALTSDSRKGGGTETAIHQRKHLFAVYRESLPGQEDKKKESVVAQLF